MKATVKKYLTVQPTDAIKLEAATDWKALAIMLHPAYFICDKNGKEYDEDEIADMLQEAYESLLALRYGLQDE